MGQPIFTIRQAERRLGVTYARAHRLVNQVVEIEVLRQVNESSYDRHFAATDLLAILLRGGIDVRDMRL